jgi:hypothetical protein
MNPNRSYKIILAVLFVVRNFAAVAQTNNVVAPSDYPKFIAERNIFDPNRMPDVPFTVRPRTVYTPPVVRQADAFSLVGIIGYGEGRLAGVYAFFDGSSPDYRKTAQLNDSIANFKITGIAADSVTLMSDTNSKTVLRIGGQLHNDGVGHWLSDDGIAARYSNTGGYGNGRNGGRNGFGNGGRRRNNNFGNGSFNRGRNNFAGSAATSDNSQTGDQNMNSQDDNSVPDDSTAPENNMAPSDDNAASDAGAQDNTTTPQTDQSPAPSGDAADPLAALKAARAAELQQIGH